MVYFTATPGSSGAVDQYLAHVFDTGFYAISAHPIILNFTFLFLQHSQQV